MRISFSALKKVSDGDIQGALEMMMGLEMPTSERAEDGKLAHRKIQESKITPLPTSGNVEHEKKIELKFGKHTLVGILDLWDEDWLKITDYKLTKNSIYKVFTERDKDPEHHLYGYEREQLHFYSLLEPRAKWGEFQRITKESGATETYGVVFNTRTRNVIKKWIEEQIKILEDAINDKDKTI